MRFETMPSSPMSHAWRKIAAPSPVIASPPVWSRDGTHRPQVTRRRAAAYPKSFHTCFGYCLGRLRYRKESRQWVNKKPRQFPSGARIGHEDPNNAAAGIEFGGRLDQSAFLHDVRYRTAYRHRRFKRDIVRGDAAVAALRRSPR